MRHFLFFAVVISLTIINTIYVKNKFAESLIAEKTVQKVDPKDVIHVFFGVDDNYVKYLSVTMASILKNTKSPVFFHILDDRIAEETKKKLLKLRKYKDFSIEFVPVDYARALTLPKTIQPHVSKTSYYRLQISSRNPKLKKCIYSDADLVFVSDIKELWDTDVEDFYMAAVPDPDDVNRAYNRLKVFPLSKNEHYVNAGILVLNLEKWRQNNAETKFYDAAAKYNDNIPYPDQDLLNITLHDKIKYLSPRFNAMPELVYFSLPEQFEAFESPAIIHWAGPRKPWNNPDTRLSEHFWEYVKLSPFAPEIYTDFYLSQLGISNRKMFLKLCNLIP